MWPETRLFVLRGRKAMRCKDEAIKFELCVQMCERQFNEL